MTPEDLDQRAAEAMGWDIRFECRHAFYDERIQESVTCGEVVANIDDDCPKCQYNGGIGLMLGDYERWCPTEEWDHAGVLIEWAKEHKDAMFIFQRWVCAFDGEFPVHLIHFGIGETLTPLFITQAFVDAFGIAIPMGGEP